MYVHAVHAEMLATIATSSMVMAIKAITETLRLKTDYHLTKAVIATDSMSTLQMIEKKIVYADWVYLLREGGIDMLKLIFCPSYASDLVILICKQMHEDMFQLSERLSSDVMIRVG